MSKDTEIRQLVNEKLKNNETNKKKCRIEENTKTAKLLLDAINGYLENIQVNYDKHYKNIILNLIFDSSKTKEAGLGEKTYKEIAYNDEEFYYVYYRSASVDYGAVGPDKLPDEIEKVGITLEVKKEKLFKKYPELKKLNDITITVNDGELFIKLKEIIVECINQHYIRENNKLKGKELK